MIYNITIYTPTYNRAYRLPDLYQSLLRQTNQNFKWLVLDDGSTDNTNELVQSWIEEKKIDISYCYHTNKGKQETLNVAHQIIKTELCMCMDSDDYLVDDAVEYILDNRNEINSENIAGLVGLVKNRDGDLIGSRFPDNLNRIKNYESKKFGIYGDKKHIYKTSIIKQYQYPEIQGEKFPAPGFIYRLIDEEYDLIPTNKILSVAEYLEDGISKNKITQLKNNPNAFRLYRLELIRLSLSKKDKLKNIIHFISCSLLAKKSIYKCNPYKLLSTLLFPFGFILYVLILKTKKRGLIK
jgi:glycosyltransferase involved in cell wall biosynthesis